MNWEEQVITFLKIALQSLDAIFKTTERTAIHATVPAYAKTINAYTINDNRQTNRNKLLKRQRE